MFRPRARLLSGCRARISRLPPRVEPSLELADDLKKHLERRRLVEEHRLPHGGVVARPGVALLVARKDPQAELSGSLLAEDSTPRRDQLQVGVHALTPPRADRRRCAVSRPQPKQVRGVHRRGAACVDSH